MTLKQLSIELDKRREKVGMSCSAVAQRAGLGLRTVQRALSQEGSEPEFATLAAIASALGASIQIGLAAKDIERFKREQAARKAEQLVALTQGTSALEAQAVPKRELARMKERTKRELLVGSPRKLWG